VTRHIVLTRIELVATTAASLPLADPLLLGLPPLPLLVRAGTTGSSTKTESARPYCLHLCPYPLVATVALLQVQQPHRLDQPFIRPVLAFPTSSATSDPTYAG
jgi:hypothetical protein